MINAAVVGLGWWGKQIVNSLQGKRDNIAVVRGVEVDPEPIADFLREKNLPLCTDYQQALDDKDIDAVILTLPHSLHEEAVLQAAAAGKQIFCEKPLSLTAASAKKMVEACNDAGIVLGLGHERRYEPAMEELARMVKAGELGTVLNVEGNFSHDKFATLDGCIFEEVSTTHFNNDSFYEDPAIAGMPRDDRKTKVDNWLAYFRTKHAL